VVFDPRNNKIGQGSCAQPAGGFDLRFATPDAANLGTARVELTYRGKQWHRGSSTTHYFRLQEFGGPSSR